MHEKLQKKIKQNEFFLRVSLLLQWKWILFGNKSLLESWNVLIEITQSYQLYDLPRNQWSFLVNLLMNQHLKSSGLQCFFIFDLFHLESNSFKKFHSSNRQNQPIKKRECKTNCKDSNVGVSTNNLKIDAISISIF